MEKVIIGIHGLANKPPRVTLEKWWKESIEEGLKKNCGIESPSFPFEMVYWADLLYKHQLHRDEAFSFDDYYNTQPYTEAKENALMPYDESWFDLARREAGRILGGTVDTLKEWFGMNSLADFVLERKLRDLHFYYSDHLIADRGGNLRPAKTVLKEELEKTLVAHKSDTIMLIAHSMGSIIAYDALRDLGRDDKGVEVAHFVTIGSPLGLPHVKAKILDERSYDPEERRVRTPSIVAKSWGNFADRRDPVAFDSHLSDDYGPNGKKVQVKDDLVLNDYIYTVPEEGEKKNYHKSYGYLRTPELSNHVWQFLK